MAIVEQPITRSELREELDRFREDLRSHYATKADLAELKAALTTRMALLQLAGMAASATIVAAVLRFLG